METEQLIAVRDSTHGDYEETARAAQALKHAIRSCRRKDLPPPMQESLDLICTKIARIISGDHELRDHWDDIAGYAKLASKLCHD